MLGAEAASTLGKNWSNPTIKKKIEKTQQVDALSRWEEARCTGESIIITPNGCHAAAAELGSSVLEATWQRQVPSRDLEDHRAVILRGLMLGAASYIPKVVSILCAQSQMGFNMQLALGLWVGQSYLGSEHLALRGNERHCMRSK